MLLAVASALLLVALVTGSGSYLLSIGAFALWLAGVRRKKAPDTVAPVSVPSTSSRWVVGLAAIGIAATLILRWPIARHDVDHYAGPDEGEVVENVLEMIRMNDFDHRHPGYPGLHFYLQMLPAKAHMAAHSFSRKRLRAAFTIRWWISRLHTSNDTRSPESRML